MAPFVAQENGNLLVNYEGAKRLGLAAWLCAAMPAGAHDFWIEPSTFQPGKGQAVSVDLKVGELFVGDSVPRHSAVIERFSLIENGTTIDIPGSDGVTPAGVITKTGNGAAMIVYDGGGGVTTLDGDRFDAYLHAHGLEWVAVARNAANETGKPVRERFHRHAKALLDGALPQEISRIPIEPVTDQKLELVAQGNPMIAGDSPTVIAVHWRGAPLAGCLVIARSSTDPAHALTRRSDGDGRVTFRLTTGIWLFQAVWMQRGGWFSDSDWESDWASLTFLRTNSR